MTLYTEILFNQGIKRALSLEKRVPIDDYNDLID